MLLQGKGSPDGTGLSYDGDLRHDDMDETVLRSAPTDPQSALCRPDRAKRLQRAGRLDEGGRLANSQVQPARRRAVGRRRAVRHARKLLQYERAPRFRFAARGCRNRLRRRTVR